MTLDSNIRREALEVLQVYSSPVQELIKQNLYGPREARLAGAIVANSLVAVEVHEPPPDSEQLADLRAQATEQIATLCRLLRATTAIIEEHVAGQAVLVKECEEEIVTAEENFFIYEDGSHVGELKHGPVYAVVFPALDVAGKTVVTPEIDEFVKKLRGRAITTWIADETDYTKRLKAMTMREIYNVGRVVSVVLTNRDGVALDGWYNGLLPWVEEVVARVQELHA